MERRQGRRLLFFSPSWLSLATHPPTPPLPHLHLPPTHLDPPGVSLPRLAFLLALPDLLPHRPRALEVVPVAHPRRAGGGGHVRGLLPNLRDVQIGGRMCRYEVALINLF